MISRSTIDSIFEASRVEEIIGDFIQLKKSGANYKGLSPFTDERTPSLMVSPAKQIWKDFSSGKGGNAITFLMEHEHYTYPEALRYLSKKYGIEIEETQQSAEEKETVDRRDSMYLVNKYACEYFRDTLINTDKGKAIGLTYFKERGFTEDTIAKFELGYSLDQWSSFSDRALSEGYNEETLEMLGLTIVKGEKRFDRFKARVIFPIHSMSGRVLGFGGRTLSSEKNTAKYINSPESEIYHKSRILYGIYQSKQFISKEDNCYLVEGYTDVIQMYQRGIRNVVASGGTSLTKEQILLIRRLTPNITILYDGDEAGQRASLRGIDMILEEGMNVMICNFPKGEDPDSFSRNNTLEELSAYLKLNTKDFITHKANLLYDDSKNTPIKRADTIRSITYSISKISDPIKREVYLKECASIMDISEKVLFGSIAQMLQEHPKTKNRELSSYERGVKNTSQEEKIEITNHQDVLERVIIKTLLLYGHMEVVFTDDILYQKEDDVATKKVKNTKKVFEKIYTDLQQDEIIFSNTSFRGIYEDIVSLYSSNGEISVQEFLKTSTPKITEILTSILMEDEKYKLSNWERKGVFIKEKSKCISQVIQETILDFRCLMISKIINQLQEKIKDQKGEEALEILDEVMDYKKLENALSRKYNRRIVSY